MKHILFYMVKNFITPIFILLAFIGCHQKIEITAKNAITFLNDDKYMFLDVRTIDEYKNKAIPNALLNKIIFITLPLGAGALGGKSSFASGYICFISFIFSSTN